MNKVDKKQLISETYLKLLAGRRGDKITVTRLIESVAKLTRAGV